MRSLTAALAGAGAMTFPVLLMHDTLDRNVGYGQSTEMEAKLLERRDAFIRAAIGE